MTAQPLHLWDEDPDDYQRPPHINPDKCGVNHTNYNQGCRCTLCIDQRRAYRSRYSKGMRTCRGCEQAFTPVNEQQHYCTQECKRLRTCKVCERTFIQNRGEAGTRYCSIACKEDPERGYFGSANRVAAPRPVVCEICATTHHITGQAYSWNACPDCVQRLRPWWQPKAKQTSTLRTHHVPGHLVRKLLDDPRCAICRTDLTQMQHHAKTRNIALNIDHDHTCCPGHSSCGDCIRGFLCRRCNAGLGLLGDTPERIAATIRYLTTSP